MNETLTDGDRWPISPDCALRKHQACNGDAWSLVLDTIVPCRCDCHTNTASSTG